MLFMMINRTRSGLSAQDTQALQGLMAAFYRSIPPGLRFVGEYNTLDWSRNFTILESPSRELITGLMGPFEKYVDMDLTQIQPTAYFAALTKG